MLSGPKHEKRQVSASSFYITEHNEKLEKRQVSVSKIIYTYQGTTTKPYVQSRILV
jgi:hypothetical protein